MTLHTLIEYLIVFTASCGFSYLLNRIFLRYSTNFGQRTKIKGVRRWSRDVKPSVGGISFYIVFLVSLIVYILSRSKEMEFAMLGIVLASTLGFLLGLSDDAYDTIPLLKFFGQIACGAILAYFGLTIQLFPVQWMNILLTIFWVVGIMNSINMLDNMDGVSGLISYTIFLTALALHILYGVSNNILTFILSAMLGGMTGFLIWNWNPSRLFMGDTGSQFLGVLLSAVGIYTFWNGEGLGNLHRETSKSIITPLLVFLVPIIDTTIVTFGRISRKKTPFRGGRDHITHHFVFAGLSERVTALVLFSISLVSSALAITALYLVQEWSFSLTVTLGIYALLVFSIILYSYVFGGMNQRKSVANYLNQIHYSTNPPLREQENTEEDPPLKVLKSSRGANE